MYLGTKVKMLEHASNIVKGTFQFSKIILPNPEILCLYIMFRRVLKAELGSFHLFLSFEIDNVGISYLQARAAVAMQRDGSCPSDPGCSTVTVSGVW